MPQLRTQYFKTMVRSSFSTNRLTYQGPTGIIKLNIHQKKKKKKNIRLVFVTLCHLNQLYSHTLKGMMPKDWISTLKNAHVLV